MESYFENIPNFSSNACLGLEQEGFLTSVTDGRLVCASDKLLDSVDKFKLAQRGLKIEGELSQFSFELNGFLAGKTDAGLLKLLDDLSFATDVVKAQTRRMNLNILYTGIPETLEESDLSSDVLRKSTRIQLLEQAWQDRLAEIEGEKPNINGYVPNSIAITGCCSASQFHLSLPPSDFEATKIWNAAHIATIPLVALSANSNTFLGKPAYAETRNVIWHRLDDLGRGRVFYGPIAKNSMAEVVEHYLSIPSLQLDQDDDLSDPLIQFEKHAKTVWPFIRLVLAKDHWRIENRAIASNSVEKTIANFAAYLGLINQASEVQELLGIFDNEELFSHFMNVSERGMEYVANISGLDGFEVRAEILRMAKVGLLREGFQNEIIEYLLSPIRC